MNIYLTHWLLKTADNTNLTEINPQSLYKYSENYSHDITSEKGVFIT